MSSNRTINFSITKKQQKFINATADEVLFGGAAGGGKSYAQLIDAFLFALKYPKSKQIIFRRTYPELERSLIRVSRDLYPKYVCRYNESKHTYLFENGSIIDFGYIDSIANLSNYQSAEYDIIRFDELTHFTEEMYTYMISRVRGSNGYPKQVKSSTNPGNVGHGFVKSRFVSIGEWEKVHEFDGGKRIFIPSKVQDNKFLMQADPDYLKRLENLSENDKKALLYGEWDIYEGQVFEEFRDNPEHYEDRLYTHVIKPFAPPSEWRIWRSFDFGYSKPFSCAWWAVDYDGRLYRILELYGCVKNEADVGVKWSPDEIFKEIARIENEHEWLKGKRINGVADPAIWEKSHGVSIAETAEKHGVYFDKGDHKRIAGWMQVHYRLKFDENGIPMMYVFSNCKGFIRTIPLLTYDDHRPEDIDTKLEDHIADETRYICMANPMKPVRVEDRAPAVYNPLDGDDIEVDRYAYYRKY